MNIRFSTTDIGKYRVTIRLFCPTRLAENLENDITRELMAEFHDLGECPQE